MFPPEKGLRWGELVVFVSTLLVLPLTILLGWALDLSRDATVLGMVVYAATWMIFAGFAGSVLGTAVCGRDGRIGWAVGAVLIVVLTIFDWRDGSRAIASSSDAGARWLFNGSVLFLLWRSVGAIRWFPRPMRLVNMPLAVASLALGLIWAMLGPEAILVPFIPGPSPKFFRGAVMAGLLLGMVGTALAWRYAKRAEPEQGESGNGWWERVLSPVQWWGFFGGSLGLVVTVGLVFYFIPGTNSGGGSNSMPFRKGMPEYPVERIYDYLGTLGFEKLDSLPQGVSLPSAVGASLVVFRYPISGSRFYYLGVYHSKDAILLHGRYRGISAYEATRLSALKEKMNRHLRQEWQRWQEEHPREAR